MESIKDCSKNYGGCCRTCLASTDTMYDIFTGKYESTDVSEMLFLCTSIKADLEDMLPGKICNCCYTSLVSFYNFRVIAQRIDTKLRNHFKNPLNEIETAKSDRFIEIKIEDSHNTSIDDDSLDRDTTVNFGAEVKKEKTDLDSKGSYECNGIFSNEEDDVDLFDNLNHENVDTNLKRKQNKVVKLETYNCHFCNESFGIQHKYVKHLVEHGKDSKVMQKPVELQSFECDVCPAKFQSVNSLSAHKKKHIPKDRKLICLLCSKQFKKLSHLKRHELCHDVNRPFKCTLCNKSFPTESSLAEHANKHKGIKPHACPLCSKCFAHHSTLTNHIKVHTKEKAYLCPICGKKFDSSTNLDQHTKRHLGLKNFACNMCPGKFVSLGELKNHMISHTVVKMYSCEQCGSKFSQRSSRNKHMRSNHLGLRPHQCDACPMKFYSKAHLTRHYRIHTGERPYKCDICEVAFTQTNDLVKHKKLHLGDNLYKCNECNRKFRLKTDLRHHASQHYLSSQQGNEGADAINNNTNTDNATDVIVRVVGAPSTESNG